MAMHPEVRMAAGLPPSLKRAIFNITAVSVLLAVGFVAGSQYFSAAMRRFQATEVRNAELTRGLEECGQKAVNLEMADKVNTLTQEKLRERVTELQTERMNLESELFVYKKLAQDDEAEIGLNLESLTLRPVEGDDRRFYYEILLRRTSGLNHSVEATLSLTIDGLLNGIAYSIPYQEADPDLHQEAMSVSFKYFKVVKGEFVLPAHFEPGTIVLSLYEKGRADSLVIKELPWQLESL